MNRIIMFFILLITSIYAGTINIAATGNLIYPIKEIKTAFEKKYPGVNLKISINSAGRITALLQRGAPYDIFLSADMKYPTFLYKKGIGVYPPRTYAIGKLVFFSVPVIHNWKEISKFSKIVIPNPKTAIYGKAAKEFLSNSHLNIQNNLIYAETVSQAFYYSLNITKAGFLSKSMFMVPRYKKYKYYEIPQKFYTPIKQGILLIYKNNDTIKFYNFMFSKEVKKILKKYGYEVNY